MPSSADIRAGAAYVEMYLKDGQLNRGLRNAQRKLRAFGAALTGVGAKMVAVSAAMAMPLVLSSRVFADFEQQMAAVSTMLDEPEKHLPTFRRAIREMSVEYGESTETLAKGLYDILSASVPAEQALDVLAVSARAAKAGITDTGTAADAITTLLNAYGQGAEHAGMVSDWLFSVVERGKTTFAELAPSIGMVATTAASAGVSLDEMGAALATMTRVGVKTDNAITALQAIIATFLKPTAEATAYAKELGFELSAATLQSEGLEGVFRRIAALPPDAIAKLFPNIRALRGVLPALKNMAGFSGDVVAMGNKAGATDEAYEKMASTMAHAFARVKQAVIDVGVVIGEAISGPVGDLTNRVIGWLKLAAKVIEENQGMVVSLLQLTVIVGGVGAALLGLGALVQIVVFALGGLAAILTAVGTVIGFLGSLVAALFTPVGAVVGVVVGLGAALLYVSGAGGRALQWLGDQFWLVQHVAAASWRGIRAAMAAGDLRLAAEIALLGVQVAFLIATRDIRQIWHRGMAAIKLEALEVWGLVQQGWATVVAYLSHSKFVQNVASNWSALAGVAKGIFGWLKEAWTGVVEHFLKSVRHLIKLVGKVAPAAAKKLNDALDGSSWAGANQDAAAARDEIGQRVAAAQAQIRAELSAKLQASAGADKEALRAWRSAIQEAQRAAADAEGKRDSKALDDRIDRELANVFAPLDRYEQQLGNVGSVVAAAVGRVQVKGAFDLAGLRAFAAAGPTDAVAANTAEMVKQQKKTNSTLEDLDVTPEFA